LAKSYAGVRALKGVSLQLQPGTILGLIGPNGSGKTTFVNCLSGVIRPTGGVVTVNGVTSTGAPPYRVARLGVARTFQTVRLFATLTVRENVEVGIANARGDRPGWRMRSRAAQSILEDLNLAHLHNRPATTLPYGLQRRVEIARAIASNPEYLLLDEPAAGMNEQESDELLSLLAQIRASKGCGLLVIDHDLRLIMRLCDLIHVLDQGETLAEGEPAVVRADARVIEAYLGADAPNADETPPAMSGGDR
jgi:branched-chain amino acid transport system ATP-binding protein